jgi:hypothetical protein
MEAQAIPVVRMQRGLTHLGSLYGKQKAGRLQLLGQGRGLAGWCMMHSPAHKRCTAVALPTIFATTIYVL